MFEAIAMDWVSRQIGKIHEPGVIVCLSKPSEMRKSLEIFLQLREYQLENPSMQA